MELLMMAIHRWNWKKISAELSLTPPPPLPPVRPHPPTMLAMKKLKWTDQFVRMLQSDPFVSIPFSGTSNIIEHQGWQLTRLKILKLSQGSKRLHLQSRVSQLVGGGGGGCLLRASLPPPSPAPKSFELLHLKPFVGTFHNQTKLWCQTLQANTASSKWFQNEKADQLHQAEHLMHHNLQFPVWPILNKIFRDLGELVSKLVGVLSPVDRKGSYQGWRRT